MKRFFTTIIILLSIFSFAGEIETRECVEQWNLRNIGIREQGYNRGAFIEYVQRLCDMVVGTAYCSCYVNAGLRSCGIEKKDLPWASAWSPSWFTTDKIIYYVGNRGNVVDWKIGDVFGLYYSHLSRIGHTGYIMYVNTDRGYIISAEANTSDTGNEWNPGEGIHSKKRSIKQIYMVSDWISTTAGIDDVEIVYHFVNKKETLYSIARKYDITVDDLVEWNGIHGNIIYLGQKLIVKK